MPTDPAPAYASPPSEIALAAALARSERNFQSVVGMNRSGILILDAQGVIQFANAAAARLLNRSQAQLVGLMFGIPSAGRAAETAVLRPDGSQGTAEMTATETEWEGRPAHLVMLHDITELKAAESRARFLAMHDPLTALPNRRLFRERLEAALEHAALHQARLGVLYLDLDRFKPVNDQFGHDAGDELLRELAGRLTACLRAGDTVARLGGDEFSIVIEGIRSQQDLAPIAAKITRALAAPVQLAGTTLTVGVSVGIALFPDDGRDAETLLSRADSALYTAKQDGRGQVRFFSAAAGATDTERTRLEQLAPGALARGELRLVYQPIVDIPSGRIAALEALLRWDSTDLGEVPPARFIPLLEARGGIQEVGRFVLKEVVCQLRDWTAAGLPALPVAVNVSARQLLDARLPDMVMQALTTFGVDPCRLILELTETALVDESAGGVLALERLRGLGIALHMDDFGTGFSSLGMLRKLPFDAVKIDRSFIATIASSEADAQLVAGIVSMAHSLDKAVIAEGVETEAQLERLRGWGCDRAQGWLFGHPEPPGLLAPSLAA